MNGDLPGIEIWPAIAFAAVAIAAGAVTLQKAGKNLADAL